MSDYQTPDDLKSIPAFVALAPIEANAFLAFNHAVERKDGLIPPKYRELISLAVALTTQCAYCLDVHTAQAAKAGAYARRGGGSRVDRGGGARRRHARPCAAGATAVRAT